MKKGVIIGAGIGGLTTAIALAKKGISVKIFEQAENLKEVGAGIWVAPNGFKILEKLGIANDILLKGKSLEKISIIDTYNIPVSIIESSKIKARHNFGTVAIHRADLLKILASYIPPENIFLNKKFKSYKQTENTIIAEFEDGTFIESDFLINADGIKSQARNQFNVKTDLRYSGQTCWRFVVDFDLPKTEENNMYEIWANAKGLRFGFSKINDKQVYVFITNYEKASGKDNLTSLKSDLLKLCSSFQPIVKKLINSCNSRDIFRTDLFDFKPIVKWTDGRMALIGDASHATTPNLGQGACQAIEDAYVIAEELNANDDIAFALKQFQKRRIKKATYITDTSWKFSKITNTTGFTKSILMKVLRLIPDFINQKQFDRIYSIECEKKLLPTTGFVQVGQTE